MANSRIISLKSRRTPSNWLLVPAMLLVGAMGGVALNVVPALSELVMPAAVATPSAVVAATRSFPVCAGKVRVTCVDGDTFWMDGTKIRIADINTPEIGQPSCASEAALGRQATLRLQQLLSARPFELASADRDEDQYGRKLRIVERDGRSIGDVLVAEGLAHPWRGHRESWC